MTPQEFLDAFGTLAESAEGVPKLRELILDLAVRGTLVPQDASDEPASALLERVATERTRLVSEKTLRKRAIASPPSGDEIPHELPAGWAWTRQEFAADCESDLSVRMPRRGLEVLAETKQKTVISKTCGAESGALGAREALEDAELAVIVDAWSKLPESIKGEILTLIKGSTSGDELSVVRTSTGV